jgi:hypothetical protein
MENKRFKQIPSIILLKLDILIDEAAEQTGFPAPKGEDGKYYYVTREDLEDYARRVFRVAVDKLDVDEINNLKDK